MTQEELNHFVHTVYEAAKKAQEEHQPVEDLRRRGQELYDRLFESADEKHEGADSEECK